MKYLDMVENGKVMTAIIEEADAAGFEILGTDGNLVKVKAGCLPVEITWEMCSCHGGRIWLTQMNTNIHIELSSGEYDTENGIDSPETELAWRIEHELSDAVRHFREFVHVVDTVGNYGNPERNERHYFDSIEKAARFIFEEGGHDLFSTEEVIHSYPNKDIKLWVGYDGDSRESDGKARRIRFKCERLKRDKGDAFEVDYEYTHEYWVYRKGLR
jgi:hypothetical protein